MAEFELEETPEIAVADNSAGKLLVLISAVLTVICVFYLFTEFSRPAPEPASAQRESVTSQDA